MRKSREEHEVRGSTKDEGLRADLGRSMRSSEEYKRAEGHAK
jgi:hypothetical protein